jgi:hypothetical protein
MRCLSDREDPDASIPRDRERRDGAAGDGARRGAGNRRLVELTENFATARQEKSLKIWKESWRQVLLCR